jgi:hypothetical protein
MDVFSIVTIVVIIASLTWSVSMLIFGLVKKILYKRKLNKVKKEVLTDEHTDTK